MYAIQRSLTKLETDLLELLNAVGGPNNALPDWAINSPGAVLWLVKEAWRQGAKRDGRKGHLNDAEIAKKIAAELAASGSGDAYGHERYRLQFGSGKRVRDKLYRYKVDKPLAVAFLKVALNNWERAEGGTDTDKEMTFLRFSGKSTQELEDIIVALTDMLYPDLGVEWYCEKAEGIGPNQLYGELGKRGHSMVVIAKRDAVSFERPEVILPTLARLLRMLIPDTTLFANRPVHIWAFPEPNSTKPLERLRQMAPIIQLRGFIQLIDHLNGRFGDAGEWEPVPLDRCFIAVGNSSTLFSTELPELWKVVGVPEKSADSILVFSSNPMGEEGFYRLPKANEEGVVPLFLEMPNPGEDMTTTLKDLMASTLTLADQPDKHLCRSANWTLCTAPHFLDYRIENQEKDT